MAQTYRSPYVVGAHYFAKFGYDDAMRQASIHLTQNQEASFWHDVIHVLDEMRQYEIKNTKPCAPLPPRPSAHALSANQKALP